MSIRFSLFSLTRAALLLALCLATHPNVAAQSPRSDRADAVAANVPADFTTSPEVQDDVKPSATKGAWDADLKKTSHTMRIGGQDVSYTATAGAMELLDDDGKAKARIYFTSYVRDGQENPGERPITFAFNGGPGSSSVWLHMGALGPRRVAFGVEGEVLPPPGRIVDNEFSWLDITDLVFIDPVSTGFSRALEGEDAKQFHGVDKDIASVGDFIRLYTTRYERWMSPKFLAGESYGTTRAAGLSGYLQQRHGMYLNGVMLVSAVLNFQTLIFNEGNDTPYWLFLPTYSATAWYHKKLPPDLQGDLEKTLAEVEQWASTEYLVALARGDTLSQEEGATVARRLARYTGLSEQFILDTNLRIKIFHFTKELLRAEGLTVGRFDSRYTGRDRDNSESRFERDPSYSVIQGAYTAAFNDYVRRELQYKNDLPYEILTGRVRPWDYGSAQNAFLNVAETLRQAISQNPSLHVLFASGRYDLATPYFASDYTITHLGLPLSLRKNITHMYYDAGHMMYQRLADLEKLKVDVADFVTKALAER